MSGFTNGGYIRRTPAEIKESMLARNQQNNPSLQEWSADIQNNLLDTAVQPVLEVENLLADTANGYAPGYANDFMKELLASTLNFTYKKETKAKVTLKFSGNVGVYIPAGTKVGDDWTTDTAVSISTAGTAFVSASSETDAVFAANTITEIKSSIDASLSVTNPSASFPYRAAETADELWSRAQRRLRNPNAGTTDYALALLLECEGIEERLVNFNFIDSATTRGIEAIVGGGNTEEIATALIRAFLGFGNLTSAPSNSEVDRTTSWQLNYYGSPLTIVWTTPKLLNLNIVVNVAFRYVSVFEGKLEEQAQTLFETELNTRKVGLPISKTLFDSFVMQAAQNMGVDMQYLSKIEYIIEDADESKVLRFDTANFLQGIYKDIYTSLASFELHVTT